MAACPRPGSVPAARPSVLFLLVFIVLPVLAPVSARAQSAPLTGRVVDASGAPLAGARVIVDGPLGARTVTTGADGRFGLDRLPPAVYRVILDADGFTAGTEIVRLGHEPVSIEITARIAPLAEAVVVSAGAVPRPRSEAPVAVDAIGRQEIAARQIESVADALRTVPGFTVGRSGTRGALTSVFPRGGESDYTLVLVDGMRVNAFGGGFDFSLLPLGDVEQIEIVRGPQSAVYGSDAIGGVVQLRTRHGGPPSADVRVEGGGEATLRASAGGRGSWGPFGGSASIERNASDGFTGVAPATGERVSNNDWTSTTGQASLSWTRQASSIRADARWIDAERGNPGPYGSNPMGIYTAVDRLSRGADTQRQLGIHTRLPLAPQLAGRAELRVRVTAADLVNRFHSSFGDSYFETRRLSASAQADLALRPSTGVTVGVEGLGERARSTFVTGEAFQEIPIERLVAGGFAELRQELGAAASLTAGVRVDGIRRDALDGDPNPFGPRPPFAADTVVSVNPRLGFKLVAWRDASGLARTVVRAAAGSGIRPPDAFEIAFTDNPSLHPERSRSIEIGVTHIAAPRLSIDAAAFHNTYDDLIIAVGTAFTDASRYRTDNISNARARGLELGATWQAPGGLLARASYTYLSTAVLAVDRGDTAPPPFSPGDPLIRRPRHQGALDLTWTRGGVTTFGTLRARGRVLDIEPTLGASGGLFEAAGFAVLDAGVSVRVHRRVELFGRELNLLGREYEEVFGFPATGRLGMAGLRVAFGS